MLMFIILFAFSMQKNSGSQGVSQADRPQMTKISSGETHSLSGNSVVLMISAICLFN